MAAALQVLLVLSYALGGVQGFIGSSITSRRRTLLRATVPAEEGRVTASNDESSTGPDMKAYAAGYKTVFEEISFQSCSAQDIQGTVPVDLRGTYFRAGPAMFSAGSIVPPKKSIVQPRQPPVPDGEIADRMVLHPFEGDGAVLAVTFSETGDIIVRYKFVKTNGFINERKKGSRVYKGMDVARTLGATAAASKLANDLPLPLFRHHLQPGLNKNRKNTSNSRAVYWGKKLLTLWEGGQPYKLDALALSTEGRSMLGRAIRREEDPFGGKMVYDSAKERALFYAVDHDPSRSEVTVFEFDSKFQLVPEKGGKSETYLPGFALLNDFTATENYAIFVQPNIQANGMQYLVQKEPSKALSASSSPTMIHLIPRVGSSRQKQTVTLPPDGSFDANLHFVNAYESGDNILVDAICSDGSKMTGTSSWPWGSSLEEYRASASKKSLWRYTIDARKGTVTKKCLSNMHGFFGVINPAKSMQRHRYIYMAIGATAAEVAPPQGLARFDCEKEQMEQWMPASYEFCGEPMYAPMQSSSNNDEEDAGYIMSVLYNGKTEKSEIVILKANDIASGPIARISLGAAVPHGLFGCFTPSKEAQWAPDIIGRRAKLSDKMEAQGNMWNEVKSDFSGLGLRFDDMEEYFGDFFN
jgi:all-trans-8'-apo-beta-carotenal 15,15'-oxygenase